MTRNAAPRVRGGPLPIAHPSDNLTHVELTWVEKRIENWIRFGRETGEQILDHRRRVLSFQSGSIFAFVRWASNDFGTILSCIDIVRAVKPGEAYQTLPYVRPGGDILLKIEGWPKVEQVLRHIDAVEAAGIDVCDVSPDHWRHIANRMTAGHDPRAYTMERHQAWLKRRECEQ
ncbi:DUF2840 domain-containing protein [Microvirga sp. KLBC 81]|uniref:Glycosidase n=1 Tax=Microvirga vignae TaxID=1225564 RepID=A0A0H1RH42_9HYPH|nr:MULTISPECIES: DUF2840 domain-containing protein [Microvirga]KLK91912.1 glycosidase [Microvirga vignae]PVE22736.1 DUF2840 domain-containing protein [Microvirga sp. KLBC 81]